MTSCCCADPSCQVYGCKQYRQTPYWQGPTYSVQPIPVLPRGCVCPPGSEATCKGIGCPRRGPASAIEAPSGGETADAGSTEGKSAAAESRDAQNSSAELYFSKGGVK